jgi:hypothetical protein
LDSFGALPRGVDPGGAPTAAATGGRARMTPEVLHEDGSVCRHEGEPARAGGRVLCGGGEAVTHVRIGERVLTLDAAGEALARLAAAMAEALRPVLAAYAEAARQVAVVWRSEAMAGREGPGS